MNIANSNSNLSFPPRENKIKGQWAPLYIEPIIGSGERITIAVAVVDKSNFLVVPVIALDRLECVYGNQVDSLLFAADVAIKTVNEALAKNGIEGLSEWKEPLEGIVLGELREGAGNSLEQIARTGLSLCSSIVEKLSDDGETRAQNEGISSSKLEKIIKQIVSSADPKLEYAFARQFRIRPDVRPSTIGFVGQRITANFGLLVPGYLAGQVKDAKAKLWDLAQMQEYVQNQQFNLSPELNRFELLINKVGDNDPLYSDKQIYQVHEAMNELEIEADRKEIRCRALTTPDDIANLILNAEAA